MRVTVFGAGGRTGRLLVDRALAHGHQVTAVTRPPAAPDERPRLCLRQGDLLDPATIGAAIDGSDIVLSTIAPPLHRHLVRSTSLYSHGVRNLIRVMRTQHVDRLVTVSSAGVLDGDPSHPPLYRMVLKPVLFDRALYRDMRVMERAVEDSGLRWVIVRASGLTNGAATGRYRVELGRLPDQGSRLSRADLADFLLDLIEQDTYVGEHPTLAY
jgi:putative NADH-flavin reductase